jgi:hypothetical protein
VTAATGHDVPLSWTSASSCGGAALRPGAAIGDAGIWRVELVEIYPLQLQAPQVPFTGGAQMLGLGRSCPTVAPGSRHTALGRDHDRDRVFPKVSFRNA